MTKEKEKEKKNPKNRAQPFYDTFFSIKWFQIND